ncbi:MAG: discoidin domain-containing protein, partial [Kiritimatiellaeota bacterium]|nr:discoidin domain-containing protein [Kiritimatiellota bacterium]
REGWAGVLAFVVGALPLLAYNVIHHGATFKDVGQTTSWQGSWELLRAAFQGTLHFLVGAKVMLYGDSVHFVSLPLLLAGAVGLIWLAALLWALLSRLPMFLRLARLSLAQADGVVLLAAAAGAALFLFCRSSRSGWKDVRYLLPIMSALPVLLAIGLDQIRARSRIVFGLMLAVLLAGQAWGNVALARAWLDPKVVAVDLELPDTRPLHGFLAAHGITRAYAHYWIAYRCTYEAAEKIIVGEPYNERFPRRANDVKYKPELEAATHVAYITHPTLRFFQGDFDALLKNIGGGFKKAAVGDFFVYHSFVSPYGAGPLRALPRAGWQATASHRLEHAARALDGQPDTLWESGAPQQPGMTFTVDLGAPQTFCQVRVDLGSNVTDTPAGFRVETSDDDAAWRTVQDSSAQGTLLFWENSQPRFNVYGDHFTVAFAPTRARWVRIALTGQNQRAWWSIAELRLFAPAEGAAGGPP